MHRALPAVPDLQRDARRRACHPTADADCWERDAARMTAENCSPPGLAIGVTNSGLNELAVQPFTENADGFSEPIARFPARHHAGRLSRVRAPRSDAQTHGVACRYSQAAYRSHGHHVQRRAALVLGNESDASEVVH